MLPPEGREALAAIAARYPFIDGEYEEQDLFGSYMSGVQSVQGDADPLLNAMPEERLDIARTLLKKRDFGSKASWSTYCMADPVAAFEVLKGTDPTQDNVALWSDFLNALVPATNAAEGAREGAVGLVSEVFARLCDADDESAWHLEKLFRLSVITCAHSTLTGAASGS